MRFRRFVSVLCKEYRHVLREPRTLWMMFLSPAFVLVALAALFVSEGGRADLAVWDTDHTALSREFAGSLDSDADFTVTRASGYEEIERLLVDQRVDAAVIIPPGPGTRPRARAPSLYASSPASTPRSMTARTPSPPCWG